MKYIVFIFTIFVLFGCVSAPPTSEVIDDVIDTTGQIVDVIEEIDDILIETRQDISDVVSYADQGAKLAESLDDSVEKERLIYNFNQIKYEAEGRKEEIDKIILELREKEQSIEYLQVSLERNRSHTARIEKRAKIFMISLFVSIGLIIIIVIIMITIIKRR